MIRLEERVIGIEGISRELVMEERKRSRSALSKSSTVMARAMRNNLSRRRGPSAPGSPPARLIGALRDTVGKDRPRRRGEEMFVTIGIGVGKAKGAKVIAWKAKGINVYEYAALHEHGGIGADGRRYPPRPYARPAEESSEAEIDRIIKDAGL